MVENIFWYSVFINPPPPPHPLSQKNKQTEKNERLLNDRSLNTNGSTYNRNERTKRYLWINIKLNNLEYEGSGVPF